MELNIKTNAFIHSLNGNAEVTIKEKVGDNQYIADYKGALCTAMFNPFSGSFYVDDIYGVLPPIAEDHWDTAVQQMKYMCESNQRELEAYRKIGSVAELKALKRETRRKQKQFYKFRQRMLNIFVGSATLFSIWGVIYYIAVIV